MRNRIQIAGIIDPQEAAMIAELGIEYLGFPLRLAVHAEELLVSDAAGIIRSLPSHCRAVLITYLNKAPQIMKLCHETGARIVQLHGPVEKGELQILRRLDPELEIIKSLIVRENNLSELIDLIQEASPLVDGFITDTFDPQTGASGATGKTHDWSISKRLVDCSPKPVMLAGGLNPENVAAAITQVHPAGVDSHTGVEGPDGRKDPGLVRKFYESARQAFLLKGN